MNMLIYHLDKVLRPRPFTYTHHNLGWVEDAQGFVLLSGLVIGIVYGKVLLRQSVKAMTRKLLGRIRLVYAFHLFLVATTALLVISFPEQAEKYDDRWGDNPPLVALLSALTLAGPRFIDILPIYLVFMLFTPLPLLS